MYDLCRCSRRVGEVSGPANSAGAEGVASSCPVQCTSGKVRSECCSERRPTTKAVDGIANRRFGERRSVIFGRFGSSAGIATDGGIDRAVGGIPTAFALLEIGDTVERVFGGVASVNGLELSLCRS